MLSLLLPRLLQADYTWPGRKKAILQEIPPTPPPTFYFIQRFWAFVHYYLQKFSRHYCGWLGVPYDNQVCALPFGLMLKWSDGTRIEEVLATKVAYDAGFPAPKIINYGYHPKVLHAPVSILMTRLPGEELSTAYEKMDPVEQSSVTSELKLYLDAMRNWRSPWGGERICSISGTPIRSVRVPSHIVGPCENEQAFFDYLISAAWQGELSKEEYVELKETASKLPALKHHKIVFTHGDLKHHNILVYRGHVSGFLDWESAGWYPDYWDFTTATRFGGHPGYWWYELMLKMFGDGYLDELKAERALTPLTVDSYAW